MTQELWRQAQHDFPIERDMAAEYGSCFCKCGCRAPDAGGPLCHKCTKSRSLAHGLATAASIYNDLMDAAEDAGRPTQPPPPPADTPVEPQDAPQWAPKHVDGLVCFIVSTDFLPGGYALQTEDGSWCAMNIHRLLRSRFAFVTVAGPVKRDVLRADMPSLVSTLMSDPASARDTYTQLMEEAE